MTIAIKQLPNCELTFTSDPDSVVRKSDAALAWSFREFILDPDHDPLWLINISMVKAAVQCIKAAQEFLDLNDIQRDNSWVISGASKRGWTALLLGSAE